MKDEALTPRGDQVVNLLIAPPTDQIREAVTERVDQLLALTAESQAALRVWLDWLRLEQGITEPGQRLSTPESLTEEQLFVELKKRRPKAAPFSPAAVQAVRTAFAGYLQPWRSRDATIRRLEAEVSQLVCQAYGLTPAEEALLWATAPPRMPAARTPSPGQ